MVFQRHVRFGVLSNQTKWILIALKGQSIFDRLEHFTAWFGLFVVVNLGGVRETWRFHTVRVSMQKPS
jgi:hypothetical protein